MATKMIPVTFLRAHSLYNKGDVAGFHKDHADELIAMGVAERFHGEKAAEQTAHDGKPTPLDVEAEKARKDAEIRSERARLDEQNGTNPTADGAPAEKEAVRDAKARAKEDAKK